MLHQTYITDAGEIKEQPLTWDGEPLYHPETVTERLFAVAAFEQLEGQQTFGPECCDLCDQPILAGEKFSDDGNEIVHTACVRGWSHRNFGAEGLS